MNIDTKLDLLKQISEVDAPPFLLTRIRQQIQNMANAEAPVKWKWAFALTSIIILLFNFSILLKTGEPVEKQDTQNSGIEKVINSMNLSTSNQFYHD